jgi:hypothetical protein
MTGFDDTVRDAVSVRMEKFPPAEFKTGCGNGWVQNADASTTNA